METTIFVPMLTSDANWIFCHAEEAFDQGLLNAEGKVLTGYHQASEAIAYFQAKQPQEPFAIMHLIFGQDMHSALSIGGALVGTGSDQGGRSTWTLTRDGANFLFAQQKYRLLMEIIPVERTSVCLY